MGTTGSRRASWGGAVGRGEGGRDAPVVVGHPCAELRLVSRLNFKITNIVWNGDVRDNLFCE